MSILRRANGRMLPASFCRIDQYLRRSTWTCRSFWKNMSVVRTRGSRIVFLDVCCQLLQIQFPHRAAAPQLRVVVEGHRVWLWEHDLDHDEGRGGRGIRVRAPCVGDLCSHALFYLGDPFVAVKAHFQFGYWNSNVELWCCSRYQDFKSKSETSIDDKNTLKDTKGIRSIRLHMSYFLTSDHIADSKR